MRARLCFVVNVTVACFYKAPVGNAGVSRSQVEAASRPSPGGRGAYWRRK